MIDLYTWSTPNGRKVSILLEELGVPYEVHSIDIGKGEQHAPSFLEVAPNNRIPAIIDRSADLSLMESGAILLYLGTKHGRFICSGDEYWRMVEWLMWQMGGIGPMLGQVHHFAKFNKGKSDYAEERYLSEGRRLYGVLNKRLEGRDFIAGEQRGEYTIADMATWPWISRFEWQEIDLADYPNVRDWYVRIASRPAVQKGYQVPKFAGEIPMPRT
ncbi:MAG: glutathione S-transferase N-terminal domain-containing protein [Albidovulum sp.]|nr:glutathione S-transferase N-terminal domain-containing protein [Albidovulum sp.]